MRLMMLFALATPAAMAAFNAAEDAGIPVIYTVVFYGTKNAPVVSD